MIGFHDPRYDDPAFRLAHRAPVDEAIAAYCAGRSCDELEATGREHDVAIDRVRTIADLAREEHYRAREMFVEWEDPVAGRVKGAGIAPKFSETPGAVWRGAPWLGMDNDRVLHALLGYPPEVVARLRKDGVVGEDPPGSSSERASKAEHR